MIKITNKFKRIIKEVKLIAFDFDGVFTNNKVIIDSEGKESVICSRTDGIGLEKLRKIGIELVILSSEPNNLVKQRAKKLKVKCINNCENKLVELRKIVKQNVISLNKTAFMGNDINDLECLKAVGFPIIVADAHKDIQSHYLYKTKKEGGKGAVRELCDLIYEVKTRR